MMSTNLLAVLTFLFSALAGVHAHIALWHPSMWGFNVTDHTYPYDNRPVAPLLDMTFDQWWFHGHLDHPPHPGDVFELPAGKPATTELACNKGATTFFASSEGGDIRLKDNPNDPCPGSDMSEWHTNGANDLFGCALGITYQSDVNQVKPEDFTVFSVNQTCVWTRFTDFQVPAKMPPCPPEGCICAWFWIHSPDSGGEQNYMNGFRCNVTGSTSNVALAQPKVARRCGKDPQFGKSQDSPGNCTYGAKQPFYWFQKEKNNMFEGTYAPPRYLDMYNFRDGAQDDIFLDSYPQGLPAPGPNQTIVPTPFLRDSAQTPATTSLPVAASDASAGAGSSSASSLRSSVPVSVATVVQTSVVTVTAPSSSALAVVPTSTRATATVFSTVVVTLGNSDTAAPAAVSSPSATVTVVNTVFATATPGISAEPSVQDDVARNGTKEAFLVEFDSIDGNSTAADGSSSLSSAASSTPTPENRVCKRQAFSDSSSGRQESKLKSFFYLPGSRSHRKLTKKSSLWHMF